MAYDPKLAERIRKSLKGVPFVEKKMFGGVGYLIHGNMACGVHRDHLMVRVDPAKHEQLLRKPHVLPFDLTGKPMKGWLLVKPAGCGTGKQLDTWVNTGVDFVLTLPSK